MTVRELIAALKKMPPNAKVCVCDHDQDHTAGEWSGSPRYVEEASPALKSQGFGVVIAS